MDPAKADPWNAAYDDEFARSGITHQLMGVLAPERFADEAMPDDRKRELLGQRYAASVQAGARNAPTVEGRFGQVCCGWPTPPTASELYDAIRASEPDTRQRVVFTTWLCESDKWELLEAWADGMHTLRELVRAMHRHGWKNSPKSQFLNNFAQLRLPRSRGQVKAFGSRHGVYINIDSYGRCGSRAQRGIQRTCGRP